MKNLCCKTNVSVAPSKSNQAVWKDYPTVETLLKKTVFPKYNVTVHVLRYTIRIPQASFKFGSENACLQTSVMKSKWKRLDVMLDVAMNSCAMGIYNGRTNYLASCEIRPVLKARPF